MGYARVGPKAYPRNLKEPYTETTVALCSESTSIAIVFTGVNAEVRVNPMMNRSRGRSWNHIGVR